jgi:hypothetical protein
MKRGRSNGINIFENPGQLRLNKREEEQDKKWRAETSRKRS